MTRILVTSWLPRNAKSDVATYMRKLQDYFQNDPEIELCFLLVDEAPLPWRLLAAFVRRLFHALAFSDPKYTELSFEYRYRILVRGGLSLYRNTHFDLINAQDVLSG